MRVVIDIRCVAPAHTTPGARAQMLYVLPHAFVLCVVCFVERVVCIDTRIYFMCILFYVGCYMY